MEKVPILVSVYDRYIHFKNCIESLKRNKLADQSRLFIAIDALLKEEHQVANKKVIDYAKSIKGFKDITLFIRNKNLGSRENIRQARNEIFNIYSKYIFSEDDNIFSPNFLEYVNKGLDIFEDREDIFAVCGYNYPIELTCNKNNYYLWKGFSAWGCGIWREKFNKVDFKFNVIRDYLKNPINALLLDKYSGNYLPGLLKNLKTRRITNDTFISMHIVKNNMCSVFPRISKVINIGHDGSGVNCNSLKTDIYKQQEIDLAKYFKFDIVIDAENIEINKVLRNYFKRTWKNNIKINFNYLKFLIL